MTDKEKYLDHWGYKPGTPEGEAAWEQKVAFDCGKRILCAPMIFVRPDVCYDSPIDGRPITSRSARADDMARNGCIEYDPEMRKDNERRFAESERALDSSVDAFVEEQVEKMPGAKRERLANELAAGTDAEIVRLTAGG